MNLKPTLIAASLMLFFAFATRYASHPKDVMLNKPLSTFPMQIGEWAGRQGQFDERVYDVLKADDTLLVNYTRAAHQQVELFLSFYQNQRVGRQIHSPRNCMPGAGWRITQSSQELLRIACGGTDQLNATRLLLQKGDEKLVMLYWFRSGGKYVASELSQRFHLVLDSIWRQRTDGAFIRLATRVPTDKDEQGDRTLRDFAELVVPTLNEYLPR